MASLIPAPSLSAVPARTPERLLAAALTCADNVGASRLRQDAIVLSLDLADALASRYRHRGVDTEDLVQVARMALVKAAHGYRPERGSEFAAYASVTILGELKRHFRDAAWAVRPPRRLQEQRAALTAEGEQLRQSLRRSPTTGDLAVALGLEPDRVREALACSSAFRADSLDAVNPRGVALRDTLVAAHDEVEAWETRATLTALVAGLDRREQRLVHLRFTEERTQTEIGRALGVSQMQVSRLLSALVTKLRDGLLGAAEPGQDALVARRAG